jgi:hypothetical protein
MIWQDRGVNEWSGTRKPIIPRSRSGLLWDRSRPSAIHVSCTVNCTRGACEFTKALKDKRHGK